MKIINLWFLRYGKMFSGGRNIDGNITILHRGRNCLKQKKKMYRFIDNKRQCFPGYKLPIVKLVQKEFYKPFLVVLKLPGDFLAAVTAPQELFSEVNKKDFFINLSYSLQKGHSLICKNLPIGSIIYNICIFPGTGAKLARAPGLSALLLRKKKDKKYAIIKLKSGEIRKIYINSIACLGTVSNVTSKLLGYKNAGALRRFGRRPIVRASAKNPVDHPMGGRTKGGCQSMSKKGFLSRGVPTRRKIFFRNTMIIRNRKKKERRTF